MTLAAEGALLLVCDVLQRTVIAAMVRLFPSRRHAILARWQQGIAWSVLAILRVLGGARVGDIPQIPGRSGILVLMNHQSLLDIPLAVRAIRPGYPRIVTRERYANGKPLISHMLKLYQYPLVNPRATVRGDVERLAHQAAESPVPLVIYPEGTRTRTGRLSRFKRTGLRAILASRSWEVWMITADGFWECTTLDDFRSSVSGIRGRVRADGPFPAPAPSAPESERDAFIDRMEAEMARALDLLRSGNAA